MQDLRYPQCLSLTICSPVTPIKKGAVKKWIKTQSRFSTLISGSGELRRIHYFKRQREIVAQLG